MLVSSTNCSFSEGKRKGINRIDERKISKLPHPAPATRPVVLSLLPPPGTEWHADSSPDPTRPDHPVLESDKFVCMLYMLTSLLRPLNQDGESRGLNDRLHGISCQYSDKACKKMNYISTYTNSIIMQ